MCCPESESAQPGSTDAVAESPGSPASRNAALSSSMGDSACRTGCGLSGARVAKPSPSVDVVGFFVGFGGGTVLG